MKKKSYLMSDNIQKKAYKVLYNKDMFINKRKSNSLERRKYVINFENSSEKIITSIQ